jgi:hypothetical protein
MRRISTYTHGLLDYIAGIILILAPNLFSFDDLNGPPVTVARTFGVIFIGQALCTNYELGIFRIVPLRLHLFADFVMSTILAASPWIFGFYRRPDNVWLPHLIIGSAYFVITAMTRTSTPLMAIEREV